MRSQRKAARAQDIKSQWQAAGRRGRGQGQGRRAAGGAAAAAWPTEQLAADSPQPLAKCPGPRAAGLQVCDQFLLLTKIMAMLI